MARFDDIPDAERQTVADQVGPLLLQLQGPQLGGPGASMVLGTSLAEELITPEWVAANRDAPVALQPTGQTVSVIQTNDPAARAANKVNSAVGYVRHVTGGKNVDGTAQITAVSGSDLAGRIRDGVAWIEANVAGDPVVRVLTAPAYQLTALGLYSKDTLTGIVVITPPSDIVSVEKNRVYSPAEFRDLLRGLQPAMGITD